jgi:hypothetical protein
LTILFSSFILPQFYNEIRKVENYTSLLREINILEEKNSRNWTLKNLKSEELTQDKIQAKIYKLKESNSLQDFYKVNITENKEFSLIKDGKILKTKRGSFLGLVRPNETNVTWKWMEVIGDVPPIDFEIISPLLPVEFNKSTFSVPGKDIIIFLSMLAVIFDLNEVHLLDGPKDKGFYLCFGLC